MQTAIGDAQAESAGPVPQAFLIEFTSEVTRIIRASRGSGAETTLASVVERALVGMLGPTSANAVIAIMGRDSLEDPLTFAETMVKIFGFGSRIIMERILDQARSECESPEAAGGRGVLRFP